MDLSKTRLNALRTYEFEQRYFVGMGLGMQVTLDTKWFESNWQWYVGVHKGELTDQECHELLSSKLDWKLGSRRQVESLFTKGAEGLNLTPLQRLPRALPVSRDWIYFEVSRGNNAWKDVHNDQSLAISNNSANRTGGNRIHVGKFDESRFQGIEPHAGHESNADRGLRITLVRGQFQLGLPALGLARLCYPEHRGDPGRHFAIGPWLANEELCRRDPGGRRLPNRRDLQRPTPLCPARKTDQVDPPGPLVVEQNLPLHLLEDQPIVATQPRTKRKPPSQSSRIEYLAPVSQARLELQTATRRGRVDPDARGTRRDIARSGSVRTVRRPAPEPRPGRGFQPAAELVAQAPEESPLQCHASSIATATGSNPPALA
jgi:Bacterial Type VI secretion, VC_A0110, EvfL, ImpJ, VasE